MNLRAIANPKTTLASAVDYRVGQAFPVINAVFEKLPELVYLAEQGQGITPKQIEFRANNTIKAVEWRYQDQEWRILIPYNDLVGVDLLTIEDQMVSIFQNTQAVLQEVFQVNSTIDTKKQEALDLYQLVVNENFPALRQAIEAAATSVGDAETYAQEAARQKDLAAQERVKAETARRDAEAFAILLNGAAQTVRYDRTTGSAQLPAGTTAQAGDPAEGRIRFDKTTGRFMGANGSAWGSLGGASGSGGDSVFYENDNVIRHSHTVAKNSFSTGPIEIAEDAFVEIAEGVTWVIA